MKEKSPYSRKTIIGQATRFILNITNNYDKSISKLIEMLFY